MRDGIDLVEVTDGRSDILVVSFELCNIKSNIKDVSLSAIDIYY